MPGLDSYSVDSYKSYFKHDLSEILLVKLTEFSEAKFAEVWEEDSSFFLHLALHVDHLLLSRRQPQGLHGVQEILSKKKKIGFNGILTPSQTWFYNK